MESWEGRHYTARSPAVWVELMNVSTAELGVGPFPFNVVAIAGDWNETQQYPDGTLVISNAGIPNIGNRDIEKVVFGVAAGIVIVVAIVLVACNWGTLLVTFGYRDPKPKSIPQLSTSTINNSTAATQQTDHLTYEAFEQQLDLYFYPAGCTELEEYEIDVATDGVGPTNVEEVTRLVRKMYEHDLWVWSRRDAAYNAEAQKDRHRADSDAILNDCQFTVRSWENRSFATGATLGPEGVDSLTEIRRILNTVRPPRYQTGHQL